MTYLKKLSLIREETKVDFTGYDSREGLIELEGRYFSVDKVLSWVSRRKERGFSPDISNVRGDDRMYLFRDLGAMC
jgi:hypothetical protein